MAVLLGVMVAVSFGSGDFFGGRATRQASALGVLVISQACGLAVAANVHEWMTASSYRPSIAIALVAWPLLTVVPAFVVAMVAAALLKRWRRRS